MLLSSKMRTIIILKNLWEKKARLRYTDEPYKLTGSFYYFYSPPYFFNKSGAVSGVIISDSKVISFSSSLPSTRS